MNGWRLCSDQVPTCRPNRRSLSPGGWRQNGGSAWLNVSLVSPSVTGRADPCADRIRQGIGLSLWWVPGT